MAPIPLPPGGASRSRPLRQNGLFLSRPKAEGPNARVENATEREIGEATVLDDRSWAEDKTGQ